MKKATYSRVHYWMRTKYGKPDNCEINDCSGTSNWFEWALKKGCKYDFDRNNFIRMCRSCHNKYDNKFIPPARKGEEGTNILTEVQAKEIIQRINNGEKNVKIAKDYPVEVSTISKIKMNKHWKHLSRL